MHVQMKSSHLMNYLSYANFLLTTCKRKIIFTVVNSSEAHVQQNVAYQCPITESMILIICALKCKNK